MPMKHATRVGFFTPGTREWWAARADGLGGSEIAAVLGLSPWESRFSLWHRKAGTLGAIDDNPSLSWGRRLEAPIGDAFIDAHPELKVRKVPGLWRSRTRFWQLADPDRHISGPDGNQILEIKTAHSSQAFEWGTPGTDQIPVYYRCQVLWYLDVFGFDSAYVAVLIGGSDYREYLVRADPAEAQVMRDAAEIFLLSLATEQIPAIDESDATYQAVRSLHPAIDGTDTEVEPRLVVDYLATCEAFANAKSDKQHASSLLLDAMGSARYALLAGERVAMRTARGDGTPYLRQLTERKAA